MIDYIAMRIIEDTCAKYGVTKNEIVSPRRQKRLMHCRVEICKALKALNLKHQEIADLMGKERTMVYHYLNWREKT